MNSIFSLICKYLLVIIMTIYMIGSFWILFVEDEKKIRFSFYRQIVLVVLFHLTGFLVLFTFEKNLEYVALYLSQLAYMIFYVILFRRIYPKSSMVILSHMMMFLAIGFIMLARLDFDKAFRQMLMVVGGSVLTLFVPKMFHKIKTAQVIAYISGGIGILLLFVVLFLSSKTYGANLSLNIAGMAFQPSEFVKISFVLIIACLFKERHDPKAVLLTGVVAFLHVLILVWSTDLGNALIFAFSYLFMVFVATQKKLYLFSGFVLGILAAIAAYFLFAHVRTRVTIWLDPWPLFSGKGSQVCNSLLGMATGGFMGTGLFQGSPELIPIVAKDFIFSAIVEEMGGIIGICVILICASCFIKFLQVSAQLYLPFYKLIGVGISTLYAVQVLLTIGGNIKFIPSTGVTLPFISYGGSSIISTFILFSIMQELFIKRQLEIEGEHDFEEEKEREFEEETVSDSGSFYRQ